MNTAIAIRHVDFEDLGSLQAVLEERGWEVRYLDACTDLADTETINARLLIILGGPIGAYQDLDYPFLKKEVELIEKQLKAGKAVLGICLGAQLMARALGARVYPGKVKEIGWGPLTLTEHGKLSCLESLRGVPVLHWHGDTFDLPDEATRLASSPMYLNQAFVWNETALALQFHLEITRRGLERWFVGHANEIAHTSGVTVARLREETINFADGLLTSSKKAFCEWLDTLEHGKSIET